MTPTELAAVLDDVAWELGMSVSDDDPNAKAQTGKAAALRESAAILRRLGDDALPQQAWEEAYEMTGILSRDAIDAYRRRLTDGLRNGILDTEQSE